MYIAKNCTTTPEITILLFVSPNFGNHQEMFCTMVLEVIEVNIALKLIYLHRHIANIEEYGVY
jgi:hypothetical protein